MAALWLLTGGSEAKPRVFPAKQHRRRCYSFARKDAPELEKHGSEAVRLSKLDEKRCCKFMPLLFPSKRSTSSRKLRSTPSSDKDAADWISEVVKDPLVEIDPITMARHLAAADMGGKSTDSSGSKSSKLISTSQLPSFFMSTGPGGFPGYILALGATILLVILATAVHLFRIRKQAEENVANYESSSDEERTLDLLSIMEEENVEGSSLKGKSLESDEESLINQENTKLESRREENFKPDQESSKPVKLENIKEESFQLDEQGESRHGNLESEEQERLEQVPSSTFPDNEQEKRLESEQIGFKTDQEEQVIVEQYMNNRDQKRISSEAAEAADAADAAPDQQQVIVEQYMNNKDQKRISSEAADAAPDQPLAYISLQNNEENLGRNGQDNLRNDEVPPAVDQQNGEGDSRNVQGFLGKDRGKPHKPFNSDVSPEAVYAAAVAALVQSDEFQRAFRNSSQRSQHERPLYQRYRSSRRSEPSRSKDIGLLKNDDYRDVEEMTLEELMLEEQNIAKLDKPYASTLPGSLSLQRQVAADDQAYRTSRQDIDSGEDVIRKVVRDSFALEDQDNAGLFKEPKAVKYLDPQTSNNVAELTHDLTAPFKALEEDVEADLVKQDASVHNVAELPHDLTAPFKALEEDVEADLVKQEALRKQRELRQKLEFLFLAAFVFVFSGVPGNEFDPTEDGTIDPDARRKIVQAALPAVAVGAGALSVITGVEGAFEMVGFTATASFVYYELLYAESRRDLWLDLGKVKDHRKLVEFLKSKNIVG